MDKENIIEKVKKLLALADSDKNASESEVQAAMLKAQELMAKYDVVIEDVKEDEIKYGLEECTHKWDMGFRCPLGTTIAENFRCEMFLRGKRIVFMGRADDAKIARSVFEMAYAFVLKEGNRHYNKAYAMGLKTKGVFNSYAIGFIVGLKLALGKQSVALMVVTPKDVKDKFEEMSKDMRVKDTSMRMDDGIDRDTFNSGRKDGEALLSRKQIR